MRRRSRVAAGWRARSLLLVAGALGAAGLTARAQAPPRPEAILGFRVGEDRRLADWEAIGRYFTVLAGQSPRVRLDTLGRSTLGRPFLLVTISDSANLARRAAIMAAQRRLADPRTLDPAEEARLVATQPAVLLLSASIHSTEVAASHTVMDLAWRLAAETTYAAALRDLVVLLVPSANPDGLDLVVDWYRASLGTPWEGTNPPVLYHPYAGHDNNRDWFMLTQVETRLLTRVLYRDWFPLIVYDLHQMGRRGARFFVPPFAPPVNPNLDSAVVAGIDLVGERMAAALRRAGRTGVVQRERFDLWWHGGARSTPTRHNMIGILTEAASARLASPACEAEDGAEQPAVGPDYPEPWPRGCWHLRDIVDYELIAADALLRLAHEQRASFVRRFVAANRRAVAAGRSEPPFAFALPPVGDLARRAHLATVLLAAGVEVHRARTPFRAGGRRYPAGTLVVRMDQPFRAHAKDLFERQRYPERRNAQGEIIPPYDVAGWTLPLQMGVRADALDQPVTADLEPLDTVDVPPGGLRGSGDVVLLDNTWNAHVTATWRALAAGGTVRVARRPFAAGGRRWPAGTVAISGAREVLEDAAHDLGFSATAPRGVLLDPTIPVVRGVPRVGLYRSWNASLDEGWTRWVLEQLGVSYLAVTDSAVRAGGLAERFDAIILPSESADAIARGRAAGTAPPAYTGGLGAAGAEALRQFVEAGGTLIALDQACRYVLRHVGAPALALRTRRPSAGSPDTTPSSPGESGEVSRFFAPGSIFDVAVDRTHPIASGMRGRVAVYFSSSTVLEPGPGARVVMRYPGSGALLSGYVDGAEVLAGRAALVDAPVGRGRVILFGFRPQHRGQAHGTFRLLTNAILYGAGR